MPITSRTALLGFCLALAAFTVPAAGQAALLPSTPANGDSIEQRLQRISAAIRDQRGVSGEADVPTGDQRLAYGFANGGRGGFANGARGGFANGHPYYGGGGFRNGGGGFVNATNGGGFVNGGVYRGGAFRNW
jgi:rSAM-associated Gly-rich repeat protein